MNRYAGIQSESAMSTIRNSFAVETTVIRAGSKGERFTVRVSLRLRRWKQL